MPFAISQTSILFGIILILVSASSSALGLYLQGLCTAFVPIGKSSFFSLAQVTHPSLSVVFDAAIAIKCFGVAVSYLIIVAQLMPQITEYFFGGSLDQVVSVNDAQPQILQSRVFWVTAALIIAGPLSYARRLDSLKYTSFVALVAVGYLVVLVIVKFIIIASGNGDYGTGPNPPSGEVPSPSTPLRIWLPESLASIIAVLPVLVFAFTCHQNMFASINELGLFNQEKIDQLASETSSTGAEDHPVLTDPENRPGELASPRPSEYTFVKIVTSSIYPATVTYLAVGIAGYLTFGNNVNGNIMSMYPYSLSTIVGRIAIVILVLFSYPLQLHPCRASVANICLWINDKRLEKSAKASESESESANSVFEETLESQNNGNYNGDEPGSPSSTKRPSLNTAFGERSELLEQVEGETAGESAPVLITSANLPLLPYAVITSSLIILSFILAVKVQSLEVILAFVGATGSTSISFILPGLFAYTILKKVNSYNSKNGYVQVDGENLELSQEEQAKAQLFQQSVLEYHATFYSSKLSQQAIYTRDKLRQGAAITLCIMGIVVLIVCLGVNIYKYT